MGLAARTFESQGIASSVISWNAGVMRMALPPRVLATGFQKGEVLGPAGQAGTHIDVLKAALKLIQQDAPQKPVYFGK